MIAKLLPIVLLCCIVDAFAQSIQQEINTQVWKPFIETFNNHDTKGFLALHSKDVIRSPRESKVVWNWQEYYQQQERGDKAEKASNTKRQIDLRFTERIASNTSAIEVGVYKVTMISTDGLGKDFYGRFHVALRKENNVWKILVDTDSSEGSSINEKDFLEAKPME